MTTKKKRIEKQLSDDRTRVRQNFFAICFTVKTKKLKKEEVTSQIPKRPANAFLMFCQRQKDVVQQLHRQVCITI